jgi:hypothetical protein
VPFHSLRHTHVSALIRAGLDVLTISRLYVEDEEDAALIDVLHRQWPEATDEEVTRGFNLALAVVEKVKTH